MICSINIVSSHTGRLVISPPIENQFCVEIRPLVVATIQRLPQRTIESILPTPGTLSPCVALQTPPGPSKMTVPPTTSRIVQPSIVVGLVSGIAVGLGKVFARSWIAADAGAVVFVITAALFVAALACSARLTPVASGLAIFPVFVVPAITPRSDLVVAQTVSLPDSSLQPEELACWTGSEA
jgi:hypothetical protein